MTSLVLLAINHLLLYRVAGGVKKQKNQSNNSTIIRPGATELLSFLYPRCQIALFSKMSEKNASIMAKKLLRGSETGMSVSQIILLPLRSIDEMIKMAGLQYTRENTIVVDIPGNFSADVILLEPWQKNEDDRELFNLLIFLDGKINYPRSQEKLPERHQS